ncbi:MAG: UDP-N-acetylmuramoyl-L-alanyl-D-glutamate--2,6-diaminopimelate ligase [Bacilli bacterium]|jgi:UDP-N-acetylmuramoyl-L-alanyl-D-glutamate--2,6-diaminopimelate ligase|nr:UDP-N-acetylmuramoyl-L-alanyl-D-glutamate--2,6-diaminopimelate ligase [Bacilli bacterium]
MKVKDLIAINSDVEVSYLSEDSNDIKANTMFFCIKGVKFDAHQVVEEVIKKGAIVIVHTDELPVYHSNIIYYKVADMLATLALVSAKYYGNPSHHLNLIGITGTNGKTTVAWLLKELFNKLSTGGYIGTIDIEYNNQVFINYFTTPKAIELNYHLREMVNQNVKYCALEVSSHALSLKRSYGLLFKYAIMTNLTFEHINFHGSMEEYHDAKKILFENVNDDTWVILNKDDRTYEDYRKHSKGKVLSYGINNDADIMAKDIVLEKHQTSFTLKIFEHEYHITTNLVALFNVYNFLCVLSVLYLEGYDLDEIKYLFTSLEYPKGRMESIDEKQNFDVIVDYAHTPDGLEKVCQYAKAISKGEIIALFGSAGGDRDREKRPVIGQIASQYCDKIILTTDDPRTEKVSDINAMIKQGISIDNVIEIEDREEAIRYALKEAPPHSMVLILGKGDDRYNAAASGYLEYEGDIGITRRLLKELYDGNK